MKARKRGAKTLAAALTLVTGTLLGCGPDPAEAPAGDGRHAASGGQDEAARRSPDARRGGWARAGELSPEAAVPVEVAPVVRRSVSSFLETTGTLEAENEVDIVARVSGPIVTLRAEEGMMVRKGDLLAQIDETELRTQVELGQVAVEDAERSHARAKAARENEIISQEVYDQALSALESARAQLRGSQILLGYARIQAPFDGIIVARSVKLAENVTPNQVLFRVSDFNPLLCPIQLPERELSRLEIGQRAHLRVEAWPNELFEARVLRISPVVDPATGTIKVTLEVTGRGTLRPGMFANVFLVMDRHPNALVIPKAALSLESLGDTVYVAADNVARRRSVELGFEEDIYVEVLSGLEEKENVIVVGQDGLSEGTPIFVLSAGGEGARRRGDRASGVEQSRGAQTKSEGSGEKAAPLDRDPDSGGPPPSSPTADGPRGARRPPDLSQMTAEEIERLKERMRARGMSEEQIERALARRQ